MSNNRRVNNYPWSIPTLEYPTATENDFVREHLMWHKSDYGIVQSFKKQVRRHIKECVQYDSIRVLM